MGLQEWMLRSCWLVLIAGGCEVPVQTTRSLSLSGGEDRLQNLAAQFDNMRLTLEHVENVDNKYGDWGVDIEYKTTSCLDAVFVAGTEEGEIRALDAIDEELLRTLVDAEEGYVGFPHAPRMKLHARPLYWQLAEEVCRREGGRLAVPDNPDKVIAMKVTLQVNPEVLDASVLGNQVLIGINDVAEEGLFRTSTGGIFSPWNETIWFPGEPDDYSPGEDCVTFHVSGKIRDVPCYYELPYICERDYV